MLRRIAAEGFGSLLLAATVIGSGIMAEKLANGNLAVALHREHGSDRCGTGNAHRGVRASEWRAL